MACETNSYNGATVIVRSRLNDLWPVMPQSLGSPLRRTHDGNMPRLFLIGVGKDNDNKIALVGKTLRLLLPSDRSPSPFTSFIAGEPFHLRVCEKFLSVLRWAQQIDT